MTGPFWEPGEHPHGLCWVQDERKLCFVNIPKCASSSMKLALEPVGFVEQNFNDRDFSHYLALAVLRDPLARFRSAIAQMNRDCAIDLTMDAVIQAMETEPDFGAAYLKPQMWFLRGIRIDIALRCDHLAEDTAFMLINGVGHHNRSSGRDLETMRANMTSEQVDRVHRHYRRDLAVYEAACELKCVS